VGPNATISFAVSIPTEGAAKQKNTYQIKLLLFGYHR